MKYIFLILLSFVLFIDSKSQINFCNETTFAGSISPIANTQSVTGMAGGRYFWTFTGISGTVYRFTTCNAGEDSYLSIYSKVKEFLPQMMIMVQSVQEYRHP